MKCFLPAVVLVLCAHAVLCANAASAAPKVPPGPVRQEPLASPPTGPQIAIHECMNQAAGQGWTAPESWAWTQICLRQPVAFEPLDKAGQPPNTLGASFMQAIFADPTLDKYAAVAPITFRNAYLPGADMVGGAAEQLAFENCRIGGDFFLSNMHIAHGLSFTHVTSTSHIVLGDVTAGVTVFYDISAQELGLRTDKFEKLELNRLTGMDLLHIDSVDVSDRIRFESSKIKTVTISRLKDDLLGLFKVDVNHLSIERSSSTDRLALWDMHWVGDNTRIELDDIGASRFDWSGSRHAGIDSSTPDVPAQVDFSDIASPSISLGSDPVTVVRTILARTGNGGVASPIYLALAKTYANKGFPEVSRQLLYMKDNEDYRNDSFWPWPLHKGALLLVWLFFGYGLYPEVGLVWIALVVIVASRVLKRGADQIAAGPVPTNWLLFTADAALPGIHLDPEHEDVRFHGWRQNVLYGIRLLGAAVIFIFLKLLQQSAGTDVSG
jgi:hypothetical protein